MRSLCQAICCQDSSVIAVTGAIDIVTDGNKAFCIRNGHPAMSSITGTGCQLSTMIAAYVTANPAHPLEAAAAAVCAMGLCGEKAFARMSALDGNSSYCNYIIDAVYNLTVTIWKAVRNMKCDKKTMLLYAVNRPCVGRQADTVRAGRMRAQAA
jgi:hydroxyethylthiazole kinase-like sugar kinase family protein